MNTSMDTLVIEIESVANQATKGIDSLISKLSQLQKSLNDTVKASSNFSKLQQNINSSTKSTKISQPTQATPKQPFAQYGSKESQFQNLGIDQSSLGKAISTTKTATQETNKYKTALGQLVTVVEKTNNGMTGYRVTLSQVNKQSQKGTSIFKAMTSGISGIAFQFNQIWDTVSRVTSGLGNVTNSAASYYESLNLFATTLGENAQEAMDWVNKFSTALYLDPADVMQYMGSFNSLIKGLGVGTDNAYLMSQQLTQLTYDLASFKNLDFETAFQKLQSGISGEIEPLRNVGVALSEATLEELAFSLGLEENVRDMSEAEKAQLRYIQIMKSSTEWQADMGKTLTSPANALRVIKQQFSLLGRAIGNVFIPIIMFAIPYVMVFTEILTDLANALAKLLEKVFGIKLDFSLDTGGFDTGVGAITGGLGDIGDAADETKNKLNTTLAPFDELNNVQSKSKSEDGGSGGLGGGDLGVDLPTYDALSKLTDQFEKNIAKARENLKSLLPVIGAIGAGFAAWKLSTKFLDAIKYLEGLVPKDISFSFSLIGLANFLADFDRFKNYLDDILENGATFSNVTGLLSEFTGGIGDIFTILGKYKLGGALKVVQGIGEIVSAIADIVDTGVNWDNVTTVIIGLTNIAIGIGVFTKNIKLAGAATAIQGFTTVIEELRNNWDAIKKGDWSGIDKGTMVVGVIQILIGIATTLGIFSKIKKAMKLGDTTKDLKDLGKVTQSMEQPTGQISTSLGTVVKNLGMAIIIIGEVAIAAGLFVGAIWLLGKELEQVGIAWQPVIDNGGTIATAIGLGTILLVAIGTAAGLLGMATTATGYTLPIAIGLGTLMLVELGVAALLFIAEIWAIGTGLDQIRIAWQPVIDNGETIATAITIATGLLIGIGVATAALGVATVASVGLLPVAIGLGTALLVELAEATKAFVDSVADVAKQINNRLAPQLEVMNDNAPIVTNGLNNYMNFLKKFASIISESTKVDLLSGFKSLIDGLIGLFSEDPIKKLAKDVDKTYIQTKDLNKKLKDANPELEEAIDLTSNYLKLIRQLDKLAKNNKTSKLSGNLFTNMKDAGKKMVTGLVDGMNSQMSNYNRALNSIYNAIDSNRAWQSGYNFGSSMANGINRGIKDKLQTNIRLLDSSGRNTGTKFTLKAYASGGYPDGDVFMANENGIPEMIGRIGNRTAVANTDQITTAIASAVTSAINNSNFGGNGQIVIYIGNKKVYEGYGQHVQRENDRYGTNMIRI